MMNLWSPGVTHSTPRLDDDPVIGVPNVRDGEVMSVTVGVTTQPCIGIWTNVSFYKAAATTDSSDIMQYMSGIKAHTHPRDVTTIPCLAADMTTALPEHTKVPRELVFNSENLVSVIAYVALFIVASVGNLTVFITLYKNRRRRSRVNLFIMHLSVADMFVTFVMLPLETAWHVTVAWTAGDAACRFFMFCRVFGFYLSSFIIIAISVDRYFAITHPLSLSDADRRGRLMLALAWLFSLIASIPQSVIFHVEVHPRFPWFHQCVTFNFFPTPVHELVYNLFNVTVMYLGPLIVIIVSYTLILCEITRKSREGRKKCKLNSETCSQKYSRTSALRQSGIGRIEKARVRTLKMTIVIDTITSSQGCEGGQKISHTSLAIVMVFLACWTPYFVISAWWWIDQTSAKRIDPKIQRALFIFAVSNSCMNPIVYGIYTRTISREIKNLCHCRRWRRQRGRDVSTGPRSSTLYAFPRVVASSKSNSSSSLQQNAMAHDSREEMSGCGYQPAHHSSEHSHVAQEYVATKHYINELREMNTSHCCKHINGARRLTPPYIANGKGTKESFDKFLMI